MTGVDWVAAVRAAADRLQGHVDRTPLVASPWSSAVTGGEVRWKLENVQRTGSFKVRGATHAVSRLRAEQRQRGVVTASSGNHGLGVATAAAALGVAAEVYVPASTPAEKQAAIARLGATVVVFGDDCVDTEAMARRVAAASGRAYVSPYNDPDVVAGQGTVASELWDQWPAVEVVYIALGGGGLCGGMGAYLHGIGATCEVVACSPLASPAMAECVRRGGIVDVPCGDTWSDSTAGGVEPGAITFPLCQRFVDRFLAVDEDAIAAAMRRSLAEQHLLVEGAAGVAIAACLADQERRGRRAAVVICGGNLPFAKLQRLCASHR